MQALAATRASNKSPLSTNCNNGEPSLKKSRRSSRQLAHSLGKPRSASNKRAQMINSCSCKRLRSGYTSLLSFAKPSIIVIRRSLSARKQTSESKTRPQTRPTISRKRRGSQKRTSWRIRNESIRRRTWLLRRISAMSSDQGSLTLSKGTKRKTFLLRLTLTSRRTCRWTPQIGLLHPPQSKSEI